MSEEQQIGRGSVRTSVNVRQQSGAACGESSDEVACEVAVALVYNGISHAVMMATPWQLDDFALGFSLSEGILKHAGELYELECVMTAQGVRVEMTIAAERFTALREHRRTLTGRTGCGLCGTESLNHAIRPVARVKAPPVSDAAVQQAIATLQQHQPLQATTGASHGAAWCNRDGRIELAREDVGRHNALDKLIGAMQGCNTLDQEGFALVSSRASYEMVQKSCAVGIGALVAVSAPTSLAIDQAVQAGQVLIGFARPGRHVVYCDPGGQAPAAP